MTIPANPFRRRLGVIASLLMVALLNACAVMPMPTTAQSTPQGQALLQASAQAHGWTRYQQLRNINVGYDGRWFEFVKRLQPVLVDDQFRGSSQERMIRGSRAIGQSHQGPGGEKHVSRIGGRTEVWYNGRPDGDAERRAAAALVTDGYRLFLMGPIFLLERGATVELAGTETVDGVECDRLLARLAPGLGAAPEDRVMLWIARSDRLVRRIWFTLEGLESTRGALAEVAVSEYREVAGVRWPTRFFEKIHRPFPLDVHRWWITGLDVDRDYSEADIAGPRLTGAAADPARPLTASP